jgi:hypothetical protein
MDESTGHQGTEKSLGAWSDGIQGTEISFVALPDEPFPASQCAGIYA